jgi:hypothetical protein
MATDDERASVERRLKIHRKNLNALLERKAKFGPLETPVWLENQIADVQGDIALLEPLAPSQKAQDVVSNVSGGIDLATLFVQGTQLSVHILLQAEQNKQIIDQQARDALWRMQAKEVIDTLVQYIDTDKKAADRGRGRNFVLQCVNIALFILSAGFIILLALRVFTR